MSAQRGDMISMKRFITWDDDSEKNLSAISRASWSRSRRVTKRACAVLNCYVTCSAGVSMSLAKFYHMYPN